VDIVDTKCYKDCLQRSQDNAEIRNLLVQRGSMKHASASTKAYAHNTKSPYTGDNTASYIQLTRSIIANEYRVGIVTNLTFWFCMKMYQVCGFILYFNIIKISNSTWEKN